VPGREGGPLLSRALDGLGTLLPRLSECCRGLSAAGCLEPTGERRSLWVRGCIGLRGVKSGSVATEADVVRRSVAWASSGTFVCRAGRSCLLRRRGMLSLGGVAKLLQALGRASSFRLGEYVSDFGINTKRRSELSSSLSCFADECKLAASASVISASSMMGCCSTMPRSGGSSDVIEEESDSLASEAASSSTVGRGGRRRRGFRLRLRPRGGLLLSSALRKAGPLTVSAASGGVDVEL
jgi:hypothetical protein